MASLTASLTALVTASPMAPVTASVMGLPEVMGAAWPAVTASEFTG
jgi:hypothetical protein